MSDLISVIVPVYNVKPYLKECLDSIINQTYKNLEIILIDDGSTDGCGKICDEYKKLDERVKVYHITNSGVSIARNIGIQNASGKYIGFVDSDDIIDKNMYSILHQILKEQDAQIVECSCLRFKNEIKKENKERGQISSYSGYQAIEKHLAIDKRYPSDSVWSKLFLKDVIKELKFPEGCFHEEYMVICQSLLKVEKYCFIDEDLYFYRCREGSTTQSDFSYRDLDKLKIYKERTTYLEQIGEKGLAKFSKENEYVVLFSFYWKAEKYKLDIADNIKRELLLNKKEIINSSIPTKRKIVYMLFYINPQLYKIIRNLVG